MDVLDTINIDDIDKILKSDGFSLEEKMDYVFLYLSTTPENAIQT